MGGRLPRNPVATRERILQSAEREFASRGFQGARLSQIALGAGTSVPLLIHHFSDKQGLYRAVVDRLVAKIVAVGQRAAESRSSEDELSGLSEGVRALAQLDPVGILLLHQVLSSSPHQCEESLGPLREVREQVVRQLHRAKRTGGLPREAEPELLALALVGALLYPVLAAPTVQAVWSVDPAPLEWRTRLARQVLLLLDGLESASQAKPGAVGGRPGKRSRD